MYEIIANLKASSSEYRIATFITCIGSEALDVFNGLPFESPQDKKSIDKVLELMGKYCTGETNVIYEQYLFKNCSQEANESINAYATALQTMAASCKYGALNDNMIQDRIVCGLRDNSIWKKLLQEPKLTLEKCLDISRAAESMTAQLKMMTGQAGAEAEDVHQLQRCSKPKAKLMKLTKRHNK